MNVLISGGCKNGKSGFAQELAVKLAAGGKRYYVATMVPYDDEDRERIARHIADRAGLGFETVEIPRDIGSCLEKVGGNGTFLVDSITALLQNEMFSAGGEADPEAESRCIRDLGAIIEKAENAVFVSDYIYSDAFRYDDITEKYRASLAAIDRFLAKECDAVLELCAGNLIFHKGGPKV
ncbi:MAG: bifunctional adenosylcobinamide kinase/adenosylcobinamide-phosphate guanylyltransferase [Lachnospiraceae bacterium]|nr:bifunctional adenosylcobinamide kinase/adenosylcobinamide-phosphate guanylyltransferase [Lachnospiraceae bacterium]